MGLFNDFDEVSHQQWTEKIIKDLKGKNFNENLIWNSIEGIAVQPFYNQENLINNRSKNYNLNSANRSWEIRGKVEITTIKEGNSNALFLLSRGANAIQFNGKISSQQDFDALLSNIEIEIIHLHFYNSNPGQTLSFLSSYCEKRNINMDQLKGSVTYDYYGELLLSGNWNTSEKDDLDQLYQLNSIKNSLRTIAINGLYFNNAGATIIQELAYSFSQTVEYLDTLTERGIDINTIADKISFNFGIGSNYFFEIAKIRAAKILWELILKEYGVANANTYIHSTTSATNYTSFDAHNNILRATTEAMSAIIGGSNSITVIPFNVNYENSTDFSERIALNIQHIIKEESFFDKVNDISNGAYYIESLTDEMVEKSLQLFKEIEQKGGFLTNIKNGFIQESIHLVAKQKQEEYQTGKRTLLGVNKHQNKSGFIHSTRKQNHSIQNVILPVLQQIVFANKIESNIITANA
ncbi:MAG: methylmalonyl-CoA mutase family protein [Flavobacteriales bacterium]